jgi:DNA-binding XRE family transcriptional regulator
MMDAMPKRTRAAKPTAGNPWPDRLVKIRAAEGVRLKLGRDLYQAEAAARLGVSRRSWIAWETGQTIPSNAYGRLIGLTFGTSAK